MTSTLPELDDLSRNFRGSYLDYDELTAQLRAWAEAFPKLVRLSSLGQSTEGREIWLLTLGPEPDRIRPAAWVDGNMHAGELSGSSVALSIAEDVIRLHVSETEELHGLESPALQGLSEVLFYVVPRMSPDGAEEVLRTGRFVRSNLRDPRSHLGAPRFITQDVDGDGLSLLMRVEDAAGEFVEDPEIEGLMIPRDLSDSGPFYKVYPEGVIEGFDGHTIPDPSYVGEFPVDLNRNFPWSWAPDHEQVGAGEFPTSEPESRAVVEFATRSPHIFAWLNLHTFGGVFIRPLGEAADAKMNAEDLAIYRQLELWGKELTGYPMVSGYEEFTYTPEKPLRGDLAEYVYNQRGCIGYVCELWDLFARIDVERPKRFVDHYTHLSLPELRRLGRWDREHNKGRVIRPWIEMEHPQLGRVEVGGVDSRVGMWNPPYELLSEICEAQSAMYLRVAAMSPRVVLRGTASPAGPEVTCLELFVENLGYLPTYILSSAKKLPWNEPLYASLEARGCEVIDPAPSRIEVGHLEGWGRGLFPGGQALYFTRSNGNRASRRLRVLVKGCGELHVKVSSCRMGSVEAVFSVGVESP